MKPLSKPTMVPVELLDAAQAEIRELRKKLSAKQYEIRDYADKLSQCNREKKNFKEQFAWFNQSGCGNE
jgi:predicted  nucleic acid-binding Zn-ribbon protein